MRKRSFFLTTMILILPFMLAGWGNVPESSEPEFSQAELDQMLAPIALYPDALLAQILMASTYPLEVVAATRWTRNNPDLEGEAAVDAVASMDWDPSVQSLVAFPTVLNRMDEDLDWMRRLGDAILAQEEQVMETVQMLRGRAYTSGSLDSVEHVRVIREREVIVIEPAQPRVVYVPVYSPHVVYGGWWWPSYPPVYWGPPSGYYSSLGFTWGRSVRVSSGFYYGSFHWSQRQIVVVNAHRPIIHRHVHIHRHESARPGSHSRADGYDRWRHNPTHRRGVAYRSPDTAREYRHSSATGRNVTRTEAPRPSGNPRSDSERIARREATTAPRTSANIPTQEPRERIRPSEANLRERLAQDRGSRAEIRSERLANRSRPAMESQRQNTTNTQRTDVNTSRRESTSTTRTNEPTRITESPRSRQRPEVVGTPPQAVRPEQRTRPVTTPPTVENRRTTPRPEVVRREAAQRRPSPPPRDQGQQDTTTTETRSESTVPSNAPQINRRTQRPEAASRSQRIETSEVQRR